MPRPLPTLMAIALALACATPQMLLSQSASTPPVLITEEAPPPMPPRGDCGTRRPPVTS